MLIIPSQRCFKRLGLPQQRTKFIRYGYFVQFVFDTNMVGKAGYV